MQPSIILIGLFQLGLLVFGVWVGLSHIKEMRHQSHFLSKIAQKLEPTEEES